MPGWEVLLRFLAYSITVFVMGGFSIFLALIFLYGIVIALWFVSPVLAVIYILALIGYISEVIKDKQYERSRAEERAGTEKEIDTTKKEAEERGYERGSYGK